MVVDEQGEHLERLSPWANYVTQTVSTQPYDQRLWNPTEVTPDMFDIGISSLGANKYPVFELGGDILLPSKENSLYGQFKTMKKLHSSCNNSIIYLKVFYKCKFTSYNIDSLKDFFYHSLT